MNHLTPTGAAELPKCTAADGSTEVINVPGYPLMVRAVDFNRLRAKVEELSAAHAELAAMRAGGGPVAEMVPYYMPSGKRVAVISRFQHLPIGTKLYTHHQPAAQDAERWMELGQAIEQACMTLPEGVEVAMSFEQDAWKVKWFDENGNEHDTESHESGVASVMNDAIDTAIAAQGENKNMSERAFHTTGYITPAQSGVRQFTDDERQFTKKPVTIQAIQWTGRNLREVIAFTDGPPDTRSAHAGMAWDAYVDLVARDGLMIYTLEDGPDRRAKHFADIGDWIIRGVKGEYYPCKPDIFEATYSRAALAAPAQPINTVWPNCVDANLIGSPSTSHPAIGEPPAQQPWQYTPPAQERIQALELEVRQLTEQIAELRHAPTPQADSQPAPLREGEWINDAGRIKWLMWRVQDLEAKLAARAPADSVLEDAARWQMAVLVGNEVMQHPDKRSNPAAVKAYMDAVHSGLDLTGAIDIARKQGANHDL